MTFAPMLSGKAPVDLDAIRYPVLASPKLDGIRAIIRDGIVVSRKLKPIPNLYVQRAFAGLPDGLDGELIVGAPTGEGVWNRTQSGAMSELGEPDVVFHAFDLYHAGEPDRPFRERLADVRALWESVADRFPLIPVEHRVASDARELDNYLIHCEARGFEGAMIRDPGGTYKCGRSTVREGGLLKLKSSHDAEAELIGVVEEMANANEATLDELGHTKRSSAQAGKTGKGTLGALKCRSAGGVEFEVGSGFSAQMRRDIWDAWHAGDDEPELKSLIRDRVKYKFQELTPNGKPRFPVFLGFRDARD